VNPFIHPCFQAWVQIKEEDLVEDGKRQYSVQIAILELFAIYLAVENCPPSVNLLVWSDNQVAIASMARNHSTNPVLQNIAAKTWSVALNKGILLIVEYVRSESNFADSASRISCEYTLGSNWLDIFERV